MGGSNSGGGNLPKSTATTRVLGSTEPPGPPELVLLMDRCTLLGRPDEGGGRES